MKAEAILPTILQTLFVPVDAFQVKTWLLGRSMELTSSRQEHHVLPRTQQKLLRKAEKEERSNVSFYILSPSCHRLSHFQFMRLDRTSF